MTKLSISVCLLLVVSVVQGALDLSSITSTIESTVSSYEVSTEDLETSLTESLETVTELAESESSSATSSITSIVSDWQESITSSTDDNDLLLSCIASNVDIAEVAESYITALVSCITTAFEDIKSDFEEVVDGLIADFKTDLSEIQSEVSSCTSSTDISSSCATTMTSILESLSGVVADEFTTMSTEAEGLNTEMSNFATTLASCGVSSAVETLTETASESSVSIALCVAEGTLLG